MNCPGMTSARTAMVCLFLLTSWVCSFHGVPPLMAAEPLPSVKSLDLRRAPTTVELMAAGQLGGTLHPTHTLRDAREKAKVDLAFGKAIQVWNSHEYDRAAQMLDEHRTQYPGSPWASEAALHVGCHAYYHGRYVDSEASFNWIIEKNQGKTQSGAKALFNKARLRLGVLRVAQDRPEEAEEIFRDLKEQGHDWRHRTYASAWLQRLSRDQADRRALLNCGAKALAYVLEKRGNEDAARELAELKPQNLRGYSMEMLSELAARYGQDLVAVKLPVAEVTQLVPPLIIYVSGDLEGTRGHYWVLDKSSQDELELYDPQSGQRFHQTPEQFAREWSGIALVFAEGRVVPGVRLSKAEMGEIFGGCCGVARSAGTTGQCNRSKKEGNEGSPCGSPAWSVNMVNMNFYVVDVPLWYSSPIGPAVNIALSYNSQSSITYHEPFGNKWQFNYASYLVVDPSGTVTVFMPDGAVESYLPDGTGTYVRPYQVFNELTRIAENHFELRFPDDTVYVYQIPSGTGSMQPYLTAIRDAHGQGLTFGYNSSVQLTTITDALGRATTLTYNQQGLITRVNDPFGRFADFAYDAARNLVKITDMGGYWSELSYDADAYLTGLENARGQWSFYTEPADGINNGSNHYPAPGAIMWEDYRITATDPAGNKQEYYYDGYSGYSWYVAPRDYVSCGDGGTNNYTSAPKTKYTMTRVGQFSEISSITYPGGGTVTYGYDTKGNRTSIRDANNHTTTLAYNDLGRVSAIADPKGTVTQFIYAENGVDLLEIKNGLGSALHTYNNTHDLTSIQDRTGNPPWTFAYNTSGQMTSATDPLGVVTEYLYDAGRQLVQVKRNGSITNTLTHDAVGRTANRTDATGLTLSYQYNGLNHLTKVTYPDGKYVEYTYAGCCPRVVEQVTDRAGRSTHYEYDALERLSRMTDPAGGNTSFLYDENGNLTALIDPMGNTTGFEYDLNDRLIRKIYADGKGVSFAYDGAGRLTSRTSARNLTTTFSYDQNDNLEMVNYPGGTPDVTFTYDPYGRAVKRIDGVGTALFAYDKDSRLVSVDGPWANDTITYQYDQMGRRANLAIQGGQSLVYQYDALNRLTEIQADTKSYKYVYAGVNPLVQSLTRPNGSKTIYQYDALKRLELISHRNAANAVLQEYGYTYNEQDQRSGETRTDGDPSFSLSSGLTLYDHNELNQVIHAATPENTFLYDEDGNMVQGYTPDGYVFQAAYDAENRLQTLQYTGSGGKVFKFQYLYSGNSALAEVKRYENNVLTATTRNVGEGFLPLQERDGTNAVQRQYTWGLNMGGGIGGLLHLVQDGQDYAYLYDGRGNVSALLNNSQAIAAAYAYDGYGNILSKSGALDQPIRFSTKAYDEKTGLSYYGYRFYSAGLGRWMTRDPLGEAGGINLYGFIQNNPVNLVDPYGLRSLGDILFDPDVVNTVAGIGDVLTLGLTDKIRDLAEINDIVNKCSESYQMGEKIGYVLDAASIAKSIGKLGIRGFARAGEEWHIGLEYGHNLNIIHLGNHINYGIHVAIGAISPFRAKIHFYIYPIMRIW